MEDAFSTFSHRRHHNTVAPTTYYGTSTPQAMYRQRFHYILLLSICVISSCISRTLAFSNPHPHPNHHPNPSIDADSGRRKAINTIIGSSLSSFSLVFIIPNQISTCTSSYAYTYANAAPLLPFGNTERRQLELCLVSILRVRYWAETVATSIVKAISDAPPTGMTDSMKGPYLEARLGSKAIITGRIGGGANSR